MKSQVEQMHSGDVQPLLIKSKKLKGRGEVEQEEIENCWRKKKLAIFWQKRGKDP